MGRYISLRANYGDYKPSSLIFRAALKHGVFRPHGLGAIDVGDSSTRWFLAGFGLEMFVAAFAERETVKSSSVDFDNSIIDPMYLDYMRKLSTWINHKSGPKMDLSPYETLDDRFGVTFLSSPVLQEASIDAFDEWVERSEHSYTRLFGTIALSVTSLGGNDWRNAYRFLLPDVGTDYSLPGAPIVSLSSQRWAKGFVMGPLSVDVFSQSTAWLHESQSFKGHVDNGCADANLKLLGSIGELLWESGCEPRSCSLSVESQTFRRDYDRIEHAFSHLLR